MHILIGILGSIVTILWLLHRLAEMGIDLGGLNPWLWRRRQKWRNKYEANPIYALSSPMETASLLVVATAKCDGDMSSEEKKEILSIFENEFHLSRKDSAELLISSAYLYRTGEEVRDNLQAVLNPSLVSFAPKQSESTLELMGQVADIGGERTENQSSFIQETTNILEKKT